MENLLLPQTAAAADRGKLIFGPAKLAGSWPTFCE